ncbi:MAG: 6,7-dimethyl-8-ribityllumazine synthase [Verrucomicrobiae bacterium]|nr:6,7-dimethyl-8-ribityllumazine synthase [Verrucomicrobiae bacterium]
MMHRPFAKSHAKTNASARGLRIAIVCAEYNPEFTRPLLSETLAELRALGAKDSALRTVRVPGSFEIPIAAAALARSKKFDAVIALGVVLQGETAHAEHIVVSAAHQLQTIAVSTGVPIVNQILSPADARQARARCKPGKLNRGREAARTAARMAIVLRELET